MEKPSELQIGKIVSQLTFTKLKSVLIHLGLSYNEIDTIEHDHSVNYQNVMFICLQQWRFKRVDGRSIHSFKSPLLQTYEHDILVIHTMIMFDCINFVVR
jgi:hypothetical protein